MAVDARRIAFEERLRKQDAARQSKLEMERAATAAAKDEAGLGTGTSAEKFWSEFNAKLRTVQREVDAYEASFNGTAAPKSQTDAVNSKYDGWAATARECNDDLARATARFSFPSRDVEVATHSLSKMDKAIRASRARVAPKAKFSFRKRAPKPAATPKPEPKSEPVVESKGEEDSMAAFEAVERRVTAPEGSQVVIKLGIDDSDDGKDLHLEGMTNCDILIHGVSRAVRIDNLKDCNVFLGPIAGSVLLHACTGCTFVLASRQVRLHTSKDCDFYIHVRSNPIIEHCSTFRFAPYTLRYDGIEAHMKEADLADVKDSGNWHNVQDFNWHKRSQSPNWSLLPVAECRRGDVEVDGTSVSLVAPSFYTETKTEGVDEGAGGGPEPEVEAGGGGGGKGDVDDVDGEESSDDEL